MHISSQNEFQQAWNTDFGDAFVYGHFSCDGVSYPHLNGAYLKLEVKHQQYRKHTRVENYTVTIKGKVSHRTRTVTYRSWDTVSTEELHAKTVEFKEKIFSYDSFSYKTVPSCEVILPSGFHSRDVICTYPKEFECSVFLLHEK